MAAYTQTINYGLRGHNRLQQDYPVITRHSRPCNLGTAFVKALIEGLFGLTVGSAGGWITGWCCGASYCRHFKPASMMGLPEITRWWMMPYSFAITGTVIGAAAGLVLIALVAQKMLQDEVAQLYDEETSHVGELARLVGINERKVQRIIKGLVSRGRIAHEG